MHFTHGTMQGLSTNDEWRHLLQGRARGVITTDNDVEYDVKVLLLSLNLFLDEGRCITNLSKIFQ